MKNIIYAIAGLLLFSLASCDNDDDKTQTRNLNVVSSELEFTDAEGTGRIIVQSIQAISATSNEDWCRVSVSGMTVSVTIDANESIRNRTALVTITAGGEITEVPVTQPGIIIPGMKAPI